MQLTLYSTSACHLCEQAEAIIESFFRQTKAVNLTVVDIATETELMERYGIYIPVLCKSGPSGLVKELFWPFDEKKLSVWLEEGN